jgi:regulator of cell morphogenesis and NO signaling
LWAHIRKEEEVLFPFIVRMEEEFILAYPPAHACFRSVSHPVLMMVQEHEAANLIMEEIRWSTGNFAPPEWACPTHRALFDGLRGFAVDLKEHIHLENDVLFPRSIQMEAELRDSK